MRAAAAAALGFCVAAAITTSAGATSALFCHSIGQHLTNDHCCPSGLNWSNGFGGGGCCPQGQQWVVPAGAAGQCAPSGGVGFSLGVEDPNGSHQKPCKTLHTC